MGNLAFLLSSSFFFALMQAVAHAAEHLAIDGTIIDGTTSAAFEMALPSEAVTSCKTVDVVAKGIWRNFHESENKAELLFNIDNNYDQKARFLVFCEDAMGGLVDVVSANRGELIGCFWELLEKPVDQLCLHAWESSVSDHICYVYTAKRNSVKEDIA